MPSCTQTKIPHDTVTTYSNTLRIIIEDEKDRMEIVGVSFGGGVVQITELDGFSLGLSGDNPALLIFHKDVYGTVASVADILVENQINISATEVSRLEKGYDALMSIETDQPVPEDVVQLIDGKHNYAKICQVK